MPRHALLVEPTRSRGWHQLGAFRFVLSMGDVPAWLRCLVVLTLPVALLGYDQWQRHRNPKALLPLDAWRIADRVGCGELLLLAQHHLRGATARVDDCRLRSEP